MPSRSSRNVICSIVFIDIVEYSKKSVAEQMHIKEQFNKLLAEALAGVHPNDRIILDTGDGAAISFLGDPEEGLFLGLALRDTIAGLGSDDTLQMRTGINLGPVRLVKDINGQPNIIGDGINVAQRVMSFAEINQVLASRSYYEVISALSADYAHLFSFEGARTDKHVREHEVYSLGNAPAPERAPRKRPGPAAVHAAAALRRIETSASIAQAQIMRRPPLATILSVLVILAVAVTLRLTLRSDDAHMFEQPTAINITPTDRAPEVTARASPTEKKAAPVADAEPAPAPATKVRAERKPTPAPRTREEPPPAPTATGSLRLQILPWGEVYVDGDKFGTAPPMRDIALKAGRHKLEIRNPGFASFVQFVEVRAGEEIRIRHRFH
jgi:hypothetical protein